MAYAISIPDWHANQSDVGLKLLISPVVQSRKVVHCDKSQYDAMGILLDCDDLRADAIVDLIRKKYPHHKLRIYYSKSSTSKTWKRS